MTTSSIRRAAAVLSLLAAAACSETGGPDPIPINLRYLALDARAWTGGPDSNATNDYCFVRAELPLMEIPEAWTGTVDVLVVRMRRVDGQLRTVVERVEPGVEVRIRRAGEAVGVVLGGTAADSLAGVGAREYAEGAWTCPADYPGGVGGEPRPTGNWNLGRQTID